jgi:histidine triad (HIT) family protein
MAQQDSVFTKIINGELPAHRIFEDDVCIVILDIHPIQPGHALVIPKESIEFIWDLPDSTYHHLWDVSRRIAEQLLRVCGSKRVSIIVDGEQIPHAHIQLIPTNHAHDLHATPPETPDHAELIQLASKLKLPD